ncbi:hypothetical protein EV186_102566 [Labedaea rhizosphaerae]|uniref:Uncharacterized protein n=2 Tax=Labedaea rhizosphaerae TaxID=598644 RepID=A0A4R6SGQ6_LABRH|nr:hypothetical protein EV186_102566 [Labedaea rhizosphaerae]
MAVAVVLTGLLAGCSSDEKPATGLLAMLGKVKATPQSRMSVEYGDLDRQRELAEAAPDRTRSLLGTGLGNLAQYSIPIKDGVGLDLLGMHKAIRVGVPPQWAGLVEGDYDVDAVNKRLADRGVHRDSGDDDSTNWSSGGDDELRVDGPMAGVVPLNEFTKLRTAKGSFAYAPNQDLGWVTDPGDDTLADDPALQDLADCLGDVLSAHIMAVGPSKLMVASGVRATTPKDATEVICAEPGADLAVQLQQRAISQLADGQTTRQQPWSEILPGAKVDIAGKASTCVRITLPTPAGKLIGTTAALRADDLAELFAA